MQTFFISKNGREPKSLARKPKCDAEAYGQIFTPMPIALRMVAALDIRAKSRLLDPCVGPATFPKALSQRSCDDLSILIDAFDIDRDMVNISKRWAQQTNVWLNLTHADYLLASNGSPYNYAILNPPYVRQEWIQKKDKYRQIFKEQYGISIPGTSNLYVYFLVKVIMDLEIGGKFSCIIYDAWQSTLYGKWLQNFISLTCGRIDIETLQLPFNDRLIDSTIIYAQKGTSFSGCPTISFDNRTKFASNFDSFNAIDNLLITKRGLRLKQANFFISDISKKNKEDSTLFIKKSSSIFGYIVPQDHKETVLLVDGNKKNSKTLNALYLRLEDALKNPNENVSILTWYKERPNQWYLHRNTHWTPILFNYYLRKRPKHLFNPDRLFSDNFYGATPKGEINSLAWFALLNSTASAITLLEQARNQGSGLAKLQLFEYRQARIADINQWGNSDILKLMDLGVRLTSAEECDLNTIKKIDSLIASVHAQDDLQPAHIYEIFNEADRLARKPKARVAL